MDSTRTVHVIIDSLTKNQTGIIEILSPYLTIVIAILAGIIAYQQYRINKQRFLFETYEKRLEIFNAVQDYLNSILREGKTDWNSLSQYYLRTSQAIFLFDKSITKSIDEIYKNSCKLIELTSQMYNKQGIPNGSLSDEEWKRVVSDESELVKWHVNQIKETRKLFSKKMALK